MERIGEGGEVKGSKLNGNQKGISQTIYIDFFPLGKSLLWYCMEGWVQRQVNYQLQARLWTGVASKYYF